MNKIKILTNGFIKENPTLVLVLVTVRHWRLQHPFLMP